MDVVKRFFSSLKFSYIETKNGFNIYGARVAIMSPKERRLVFCFSKDALYEGDIHISMLNPISIQTRTLTEDYGLKQQYFYIENVEKIPLILYEETESSSRYRGPVSVVVTLMKTKRNSIYPSNITLSSALNTFNCIVTNA